MDKIEYIVAFVLAVLVAMAPLGMIADSLWRRREKGRYIVEVWNADHTRLLATITATVDDRLPAIGETMMDLQDGPGDGFQDSPGSTETGPCNKRKTGYMANHTFSFVAIKGGPKGISVRGHLAEKKR